MSAHIGGTASIDPRQGMPYGRTARSRTVDEALAGWESDCGEDAKSYAIKQHFPGQTYTLKVGPQEVLFSVKQDFLSKSGVFDRMVTNTNGREYHAKHINLPDENAKYFSYMIEFFQKGVYEVQEDKGEDILHELSRMYVLADRYEVPDLKLALAKHMARFHTLEELGYWFTKFHEPFVDNVCAVYERLSDSDILYRDYIRQTIFVYYMYVTCYDIEDKHFEVDLLLRRGGRLAEDVFAGTCRAMRMMMSKSNKHRWELWNAEYTKYKMDFTPSELDAADN